MQTTDERKKLILKAVQQTCPLCGGELLFSCGSIGDDGIREDHYDCRNCNSVITLIYEAKDMRITLGD